MATMYLKSENHPLSFHTKRRKEKGRGGTGRREKRKRGERGGEKRIIATLKVGFSPSLILCLCLSPSLLLHPTLNFSLKLTLDR